MNVQEKIDRVKTQILLGYAWWATLMLNLRVVYTDRVSTMAVDGTYLYINEGFIEGLSDTECRGVLMHEVAHCALLHCYRRKWREPILWNIAADAAANALLAADGIALPPGCVPAADLMKTAEEIYDELDRTGESGSGANKIKVTKIVIDVLSPGDEPGGNESGQSSQVSQSNQMTEQSWRDVLAGSRGLEPGGLSRAIDQSREARRDWRAELAEFMHATTKDDTHTWSRPSRRIAGLPGWRRTPQARIAICVDTSGSIGDDLLSMFLAECRAIASLIGIEIALISCDAAVTQTVLPGEEWPKEFIGGGGTDFTPALRRAEELDADAVLYFTDGDGTFPQRCMIPVLWALTQSASVPFGRTVRLEI